MFFSKRAFNALSSSSRCSGDKSSLLLFMFRALVALIVVAFRVSYLLLRCQANMRVSHLSPAARNRQENLGCLLHKRCLLLQRKHQISVALCLRRERSKISYLLHEKPAIQREG